ncbi:MAG TPA: carboxypeptidase-like regulatory domain-containing protein [Polyangia bacterium]|jgi:hypothetical protein
MVSGEVIDARLRSGVAGREVVVIATRHGRERRFVTRADAHGRFALRLPLGAGAHRLRLAVVEDGQYGGTEAAERRVTITAPVPRRWLTLPLGLTAVLLAAGGLWRLRRRQAGQPAAGPPAEVALRPGLHAARAGRLHSLRPRDDHGFCGHVVDVYTRRGVPAATVDLAPEAGGAAPRLDSAADGCFAAEALAPGRYQVTVTAAGYLSERFVVALPHRGELRGVRVELMPVRLRVLEVYRGVALALLPDPDLLWIRTPREVLTRSGAGPSHRALARLVERSYYSGAPVDEAAIGEAQRLAADVQPDPPGPAAATRHR